jgi:hypothetical protein
MATSVNTALSFDDALFTELQQQSRQINPPAEIPNPWFTNVHDTSGSNNSSTLASLVSNNQQKGRDSVAPSAETSSTETEQELRSALLASCAKVEESEQQIIQIL